MEEEPKKEKVKKKEKKVKMDFDDNELKKEMKNSLATYENEETYRNKEEKTKE